MGKKVLYFPLNVLKKVLKLELHWQILMAIILGWFVGKLTGTDVEIFGVSFFSVWEFLATLFLNALKMIVIPLIVSSMIIGVGSISSMSTLERMGGYTFSYYVGTSILAILTGLFFVNLISPGTLNGEGVEKLLGLSELDADQLEQINNADIKGIADVLLNMIPSNIIGAAYSGHLLGLITFSLLFGYGLGKLDEPYQKALTEFWHGSFNIIMTITHLVMKFAPIGVFALIAKMSALTGYEALKTLFFFFITVVFALSLHFFITLPLILKFVAKVNPIKQFQAMAPALLTAFSTSSSSATLPITMECLEENAGVSNRVSSFVLPLGATVNMDGTALYECVVAIFVAQIYGIDLSIPQQFIIAFTALITSIGVAGVPSASLVAIPIVLGAVGLPLEAIGAILAVDRLLDMMRTSVNIFGDASGAVVVAKLQGEKRILE